MIDDVTVVSHCVPHCISTTLQLLTLTVSE